MIKFSKKKSFGEDKLEVKDMTELYLESYNDVFLDIVNVYFAINGVKDLRIERPEDLQDAQTRTVYKSEGKVREQERDRTKLWIKEGQ